jgi:hypothetical protein
VTLATRLFDDEGRDLRTWTPGSSVDEDRRKCPDGLDIFTERGITPPWAGGVVAIHRGYVRYEQGDVESVLLAEPRFRGNRRDTGKPYLGWVRHVVRGSGGWIMPKFAPLAAGGHWAWEVNPFAQLRPDLPVRGKSYDHNHHRGFRHKATGCPCHTRGTHHQAWLDELVKAPDSLRMIPRRERWNPPLRGPALRAHEAGKMHVDPQGTGEPFIPLEGWHHHVPEAKYQLTPGEGAKRWDINPVAALRGITPEHPLAVVCLEGTPKTDAITEAGYWCVGTPSVTSWDAYEGLGPEATHELGLIADRIGSNTPTVVICDSDWHVNDAVRWQAIFVTLLLEGHGVTAVAAAPPEGADLGWNHGLTGERVMKKVGVDDHLGAGHDLLDIITREFLVPAPGLEDLASTSGDPRSTQSLRAVARALGRACTRGGHVSPSPEAMAASGLSRNTIVRRLIDLESLGLLTKVEDAYRVTVGGKFRMMPALYTLDPSLIAPVTERTLRAWMTAKDLAP